MVGEADQDYFSRNPQAAAAQEFQPLDPRVVRLWFVADLIGFGVTLLILLTGLLIAGLAQPWLLWWLIGGWGGLAALCLWYCFWRPPRAYRAWGYRIDARVLEVRNGILFRRIRLIPLSRLQHVDLERGPLERMYGLASLVLHTAGTHAASVAIPGLEADAALRLRDHLIEAGGDDAV